MDSSAEDVQGQHSVIISAALVAKIEQQCVSWQILRGWHKNFDQSISQVDKVAAIKGYDLIVDGVINARQIARELGFTLPDVSQLKWDLAPRPARQVQEF